MFYVAFMTLEGVEKTDMMRLSVMSANSSSEEAPGATLQQYAIIHACILVLGIMEAIFLLLTNGLTALPVVGMLFMLVIAQFMY